MNKSVAVVCAVIFVITLNSENCYSLEYNLSENNEKEVFSPVSFINTEQEQNDLPKEEIESKSDETIAKVFKRVVRQAYQSHTPLYPNLPSGPPYGSYPNHNNQNPSYNQQWQHSNNNYSQPGYPFQSNGYRPNPNNHYGTNYTQPKYPSSQGYKPSNFTHNPSGSYGQNAPSTWQPHYQPNNGQRPYNQSSGNYSFYTSTVPNFYPGYQPGSTYTSTRPFYNPPGQFNNNNHTYPGYPSHMQGYRPANTTNSYPYNANNGVNSYNPNQRPQYNYGQSQFNSTRYPLAPGNQHPVIYDDSTKRPGQGSFGNYNTSNFYNLNNTHANGRPPYYAPSGTPQYFNAYPNSPGSPNSNNPYNMPNQRPPYQGSPGQYPPNSYPGHTPGSDPYNLANNRYNPSIPNKPLYDNPSPYGNGPNSNYDPTKVSPQLFNSH